MLEPSPDGTMQVNEGFIYKNDGKTTWNDPDRGTLQFELPAAAQGKVEVNVLAPGGLPIRRAPDPLGKPNTVQSRFSDQARRIARGPRVVHALQHARAFLKITYCRKAALIRMVAPTGVKFKGD